MSNLAYFWGSDIINWKMKKIIFISLLMDYIDCITYLDKLHFLLMSRPVRKNYAYFKGGQKQSKTDLFRYFFWFVLFCDTLGSILSFYCSSGWTFGIGVRMAWFADNLLLLILSYYTDGHLM